VIGIAGTDGGNEVEAVDAVRVGVKDLPRLLPIMIFCPKTTTTRGHLNNTSHFLGIFLTPMCYKCFLVFQLN